jgi:hypothetical protein
MFYFKHKNLSNLQLLNKSNAKHFKFILRIKDRQLSVSILLIIRYVFI